MSKAIANGKTGYCPAAGIPELRSSLAKSIGDARGGTLVPVSQSHWDNLVIWHVLRPDAWTEADLGGCKPCRQEDRER